MSKRVSPLRVRAALFFPWTLLIYLLSMASFALFVPPQGIWESPYWHRFFLFPAIVVSAIGAALLPEPTGLRGAIRSGLIGCIASIVVTLAGCNISHLSDEGQPWYGIPAFPIVFFSTAVGALIGASRFR